VGQTLADQADPETVPHDQRSVMGNCLKMFPGFHDDTSLPSMQEYYNSGKQKKQVILGGNSLPGAVVRLQVFPVKLLVGAASSISITDDHFPMIGLKSIGINVSFAVGIQLP
jgi:hypothetical protein